MPKVFLVFVIVKWIHLGFGLLFGQSKQFKYVILDSDLDMVEFFVIFCCYIDQMMNWSCSPTVITLTKLLPKVIKDGFGLDGNKI